ncbi:hypothetical protein IWQ51_002097 [Labrenzia sp. EL_142]|nr:hypothetical protein [Labrenzia sp. EL_142]
MSVLSLNNAVHDGNIDQDVWLLCALNPVVRRISVRSVKLPFIARRAKVYCGWEKDIRCAGTGILFFAIPYIR